MNFGWEAGIPGLDWAAAGGLRGAIEYLRPLESRYRSGYSHGYSHTPKGNTAAAWIRGRRRYYTFQNTEQPPLSQVFLLSIALRQPQYLDV
jgi:hypothetical protein